MPKLSMIRKGNALVPSTKAAERTLDGIKPGAVLGVDAAERRNGKFHRLYWAMCQLIADALNAGPSGREWDQEAVSDALKIGTGHAKVVALTPAMQRHYGVPAALVPASVSFAKMDETQFGRFVEGAVAYVIAEFGPWVQDHPDWRQVREIVAHAQGRPLPHPDERTAA